MRAVARVLASFALLTLVALGFSMTVRVCGPSDARARELPRDAGRSGPRSEPASSDDVAVGDGLDMRHLSVWDSADGAPYVYLSFTPITLQALEGEVRFRTAVVEGEEIEVADVAPALDEAHIAVALDGERVSVASLQWYYAGYGDLGGADMKYMPVCLVRAERPDLSAGEHDVVVRIEDVETGATGGGSATLTCGARVGEL